jgi:hypothetical protein
VSHWRLIANHTHLYPGAHLQIVERGSNHPDGDDVLVEFADGEVAEGTLSTREHEPVLRLDPYITGRKTAIAATTWALAFAGRDTLNVRAKSEAHKRS